jgi:hypothetical protein
MYRLHYKISYNKKEGKISDDFESFEEAVLYIKTLKESNNMNLKYSEFYVENLYKFEVK